MMVARVLHNSHALGTNFKPVEFLAVHAGLHIGLEVVAHGLEMAAHSSMFTAAHVGLEVAASTIPILGLALFAPMLAYDSYTAYHHYKWKTHHAKEFAGRIVLKADCMEEKIVIKEADAEKSEGFLKKEVGEVCGRKQEVMLSKQIQRANFELVRLLQTIESVGRCLWPHGDRRWSKANCVQAIYMPMRGQDGTVGMLFGALSSAATYARSADALLEKPVYGDSFKTIFGIDLPQDTTHMQMIHNFTLGNLTDRIVGCMAIVAEHRAFERLFERLNTGVEIWTRTFARALSHRDMRTLSYSQICKRVFNKLPEEDGEDDLGMCKDEQFSTGHGEEERIFGEDHPCENERELDFGTRDNDTMLWPEGDHH
jgi:hypothetical protein